MQTYTVTYQVVRWYGNQTEAVVTHALDVHRLLMAFTEYRVITVAVKRWYGWQQITLEGSDTHPRSRVDQTQERGTQNPQETEGSIPWRPSFVNISILQPVSHSMPMLAVPVSYGTSCGRVQAISIS